MAKVDFTTGNFDLVIEGELNADKQQEALEAGLRYIVQRDGATTAYKNLKLEGERKSLPFTQENADAVRAAFQEALSKYGNFSVTASEHVAAETVSSRKQATELWNQVKGMDAKLQKMAYQMYSIPDGANDEAGIEACHAFLSTLRKSKPATE